MSKIIIIEGNSNDKDNVRNFMVKGEPGQDGVSPSVETSKTGDTATIKITDAEGEHEFDLKDGVSPTITPSKSGTVTTLTIVDAEGTKTATINDGEVNVSNTFDTVLDPTKTAPSLNATENYVEDFVENYDNYKFAVITGSIADIPDGEQGSKRIYPPEGFTAANSVVISVMYGETADADLTPSASDNTYVRASDDMFGWKVFITNNYGSTQTLYYKVTIMKVS